MSTHNIPNVKLENAKIFYRNFAGAETRVNPRGGARSFCVYIDDPAVADDMARDGWNVKIREPREEGDEPRPYIQVAVSFDGPYPPKVILVCNNNPTPLNELTIKDLDTADIINVDLVIRPYQWSVNGKGGVKAYLKTMYVTIEPDEFADKYQFDDPFM